MRNLISLTLLLVLSAVLVMAQEPDGESVPAESTTAAAEETAPGDEAADAEETVDDADLDEQTYEEDDDDFIPTEEIPADEPIPFPSNI